MKNESLLLKFKKNCYRIMQYREYRRVMRKLGSCDPRRTFILAATPEYANIGDHAITIAERAFLRDRFPDYEVIEINHNLLVAYFTSLAGRMAELGVTILMQGGGNTGSLHFFTGEYPLRLLLTGCPDNRIVVFPQTYFCSNDEAGRRILEESRNIYASHKKFTMFLRDGSWQKAMKYFPDVDIESAPDIVLYLDGREKRNNAEKSGVLLCFRNDAEKSCSDRELEQTLDKLKAAGETLLSTTMIHSLPRIFAEGRQRVVEAKLAEFSRAEVVVTDRLHAMILATVTNTPCIALDNTTGKVGGVYQKWLKNLGFIRLVSSPEEIPGALADLRRCYGEKMKRGIQEYDKAHFSTYWTLIETRLRS